MADRGVTTATTEVPAQKNGGFPPFKTETFPSQLFWLAITFGFLFVVLWRVAGPRINAAITLRRNTISAAIEAANKARGMPISPRRPIGPRWPAPGRGPRRLRRRPARR